MCCMCTSKTATRLYALNVELGDWMCSLSICLARQMRGRRYQVSSQRNEEDYVVFVLDSLYLNYCVVLCLPLPFSLCSMGTAYGAKIFFLCIDRTSEGRTPRKMCRMCMWRHTHRALSTTAYLSFSAIAIYRLNRSVVRDRKCIIVCVYVSSFFHKCKHTLSTISRC